MKINFESASLKVWFSNKTTQLIKDICEIEIINEIMIVTVGNGEVMLINFKNVDLIESWN